MTSIPTVRQRVVSVHGCHPVSGVSTWIERVLTAPGTRHDWHAVITGTCEEHDAMAAFPGEAGGCVTRCVWDASPGAVAARIASLRGCLQQLGCGVVIPNYVPEAFAAGFLESARGVRLIGVCHSRDVWYHELFEQCGAGMHGAWAVSDECRKLIGGSLRPGVPLLSAPYGTALPTKAPAAERSAGAPVRLLYAGRLESMQKRVMRLGDLADALADRGVPFSMTIAGDGPDRDRLSARLASHTARGDVTLTGPVNRARIDALLSACDALVLVSAYEGTPLAAMEAMAMGRPVLLSPACGGACDAVRQSGGGMIAESVDQLAGHVQALAENPGLGRALGNDARRAAEIHFDLSVHINRIESLIDRAAASPQPGPAETWDPAVRAAALGAPRGARGLDRRTLCRWRRGVLRDARAHPGGPVPRRSALSVRRPSITRAGSRLLSTAVHELVATGHRRVAVFPAGRHSARFGITLRGVREIACFVDDADGARRLHGHPVLTPQRALSAGIDAVVISSDQYEQTFFERAAVWAGDLPVRTLYVPIRLTDDHGPGGPNDTERPEPTVGPRCALRSDPPVGSFETVKNG